MAALVTGSAGHLGEGLMRTLAELDQPAEGIDVLPSDFTTVSGSINDRALVRRCLAGVETVYHTATLHKPHVATHDREAFVETNIRGTLTLLEESAAAGVRTFVLTSTTSVFGDALRLGRDPRSPLAQAVGAKGYHDRVFEDGPFPVID